MGYIMNLRKYIGHKPIIMTSGCVLILNEKNQLLLQKRKDNGYWAYPGGSLELGESFEECDLLKSDVRKSADKISQLLLRGTI